MKTNQNRIELCSKLKINKIKFKIIFSLNTPPRFFLQKSFHQIKLDFASIFCSSFAALVRPILCGHFLTIFFQF
jgi:hypothetical protein